MDDGNIQLWHGDCLEVMKGIPDASIDAIITDPPYFQVKDADWDNQWESADGFIDWLGLALDEYRRLLKPDGSLYVFASPQMASRVEIAVGRRFRVLNHIVWRKESGKHKQQHKEGLRRYFPQTERIIFAEPFDAKCSAPTKPAELRRLEAIIAGKTDCARSATLQQRERFDHLQTTYRRLHNAHKDSRRPFTVSAAVPYTDCWDFTPVNWYPGKHPCEKPQALLRHILEASTRPGDLVLDSFMGSGSMGMACATLGRGFIGIEMDSAIFVGAEKRLK